MADSKELESAIYYFKVERKRRFCDETCESK